MQNQILLPLVFLAALCHASWWLSRRGGWHSLSQIYRAKGSTSGKAYYMQDGIVGGVGYGHCLIIRVAPDGSAASDVLAFPHNA